MYRRLLPVLVVGLDTGLMLAAHPGGWPGPAAAYLAVALLVIGLGRWPVAAFALTLLLAPVSGSGHVLLLWTAYRAGRQTEPRPRTAMVVGAAAGGLAAQILVAAVDPRLPATDGLQRVVATYVVFVGLPLLAGGYLAQHERLLAVLRERNRELRGQRHLIAEQERLRERLRIARDMHDSLGQRLSLVSVQAAALEVADLPAPQRFAAGQLAVSARTAMSELHELVGALRRDPEPDAPGIPDIFTVVGEFRAAGVPVTLHQPGDPRPIAGSGGSAAYRVVQEGLTNAARHSPGQPVTISLHWEPDTLLVTVTNPTGTPPGDAAPGHGLAGLAERVELAGGYLEHRSGEGAFRLVAMLPVLGAAPVAEPAARGRGLLLGIATGVLMFVVLPASLLLGVR